MRCGRVGLLVCGWCLVLLGWDSAAAQTQLTENTWRLDQPAARPAARIEQATWLSGTWQGQGLGGECEEWWGQPRAGRMQGAFRYDQDGKLVFSEHFVLAEDEGSLILKLKHFSADFKGWEGKDECEEFRLVEVKDQEIRFEGLTYRLVGADKLEAYVVVRGANGEQREEKFEFQRR